MYDYSIEHTEETGWLLCRWIGQERCVILCECRVRDPLLADFVSQSSVCVTIGSERCLRSLCNPEGGTRVLQRFKTRKVIDVGEIYRELHGLDESSDSYIELLTLLSDYGVEVMS